VEFPRRERSAKLKKDIANAIFGGLTDKAIRRPFHWQTIALKRCCWRSSLL
jgi:hypothetical protein